MNRYYIGVDWGDRLHELYVCDVEGKKVEKFRVKEDVKELAEVGRWLDEQRAVGLELWAALRSQPDASWIFFWTTQ